METSTDGVNGLLEDWDGSRAALEQAATACSC